MMRRAVHHHPCTSIEEWDALAIQVTIAKADLATRDGYSPNMLAFGRRPRMLPSSLDEVDSDVVTSVSKASNGDQTLRFVYKTQGAFRQAAQEVEASVEKTQRA